MKVILLSIAFVTLVVRSEGQSCDANKMSECVTMITDAIGKDMKIAEDKDKMCGVLQSYTNCVLKEACEGVELTDDMKQQIMNQQKQYGLDCDLDLSAGAAVVPFVFTTIVAVISSILLKRL